MAVRPAASRGGDGMLYGMITFVVLTVVGLGGFIWQLTSNKALVDRNTRLENDIKKLGAAPSYYVNEQANRGGSQAEIMAKDLRDLAVLVSGKPDAVAPAVEAEARAVLSEIERATPGVVGRDLVLLTALTRLHKAYADLVAQKNDLQARYTDREAELNTMANNVKTVQDEFEAKVAELQADVERIQRDAEEALAAKDRQLADLQASTDATTDEMNKARVQSQAFSREAEIREQRLRRQIDELQGKIAQLRPGAFDAQAILTKSDGQVLRAIPGSEVVYISVGAADGVKPGMKFEVFSPFGERMADDYRGKATIEVATVLDTTSECKVTRATPAKPIVEGDAIVNVVFERNRRTKFVVRGDFDLDYDGEIDWDGVDKISAIIRAWGGAVVPDVDESVDFVVLGLGPQSPDVLQGRRVSTIVEDLVRTRQREREQWLGVIESARTRNIPILTQNQFLFLTGFADGSPPVVR